MDQIGRFDLGEMQIVIGIAAGVGPVSQFVRSGRSRLQTAGIGASIAGAAVEFEAFQFRQLQGVDESAQGIGKFNVAAEINSN